ncbi:MAG: DNA polymerase III subunit [Planctomycetales bacterium]|nr:DNA polymerase III subunit [Planctomycetales bacterium]
MSWCGLDGHDAIVQQFRCSLQQKRLASTFLFVGPSGIGKRQFALRLAQAMLCDRTAEVELQPCQACDGCIQVAALTHPDLEIVSKPDDKSFIPLDSFIGDREHRAREGLCHWISLKPTGGKRRIALIDDADHLNEEGANSLLKTLEEPPPRSLLVLIGTSVQRQLPTIRSRCQIVRFHPLPAATVRRLLETAPWLEVPGDEDRERFLDELVTLAEGSLDRAREFGDIEMLRFLDHVLANWCRPDAESWVIAKEIHAFMEKAGKEAPAKRARLRLVIERLIGHMRSELSRVAPTQLAANVSAGGVAEWDILSQRIDRSLAALQHIDSFGNLSNVIECWIDDIWQTTRNEF